MVKVNLGCGNTFLEDWINIDFLSNSDKVVVCARLALAPREAKHS